MQTELSRIHRQVRTTFVFVTHDQEEALSMATRIAVMSGGRISQVGTPREIYYRPVDRFVADFIGESNFIPGVVEHDGDRAWLAVSPAERIPVPAGSPEGAAILMVRPESLELGASPDDPSRPGLRGRITHVAFLGNHMRITVDTAAGAIVVHRPHQTGAGELTQDESLEMEVCIWWADDAAMILEAD
jgi:spermidine/putrescine transport system ATP-binding protein